LCLPSSIADSWNSGKIQSDKNWLKKSKDETGLKKTEVNPEKDKDSDPLYFFFFEKLAGALPFN